MHLLIHCESVWFGAYFLYNKSNVFSKELCWCLTFSLHFLSSTQRPGMTSGARMPHQGAPMGPPGPPYGGTPQIRPGMPNPALDPNRKRPAPTQPVQPPPVQNRSRKWVPLKLFSDLLILDPCIQQINKKHEWDFMHFCCTWNFVVMFLLFQLFSILPRIAFSSNKNIWYFWTLMFW